MIHWQVLPLKKENHTRASYEGLERYAKKPEYSRTGKNMHTMKNQARERKEELLKQEGDGGEREENWNYNRRP